MISREKSNNVKWLTLLGRNCWESSDHVWKNLPIVTVYLIFLLSVIISFPEFVSFKVNLWIQFWVIFAKHEHSDDAVIWRVGCRMSEREMMVEERVVWVGKHQRMADQESNKKINQMIRRQSKRLLCLGRKGSTVFV